MEHIEEQDVLKLKELLRRTGEFIAYFELAETKMIEWRQDIEQQALKQQQQFQQQLHALQTEFASFHEILTQAGLARFRIAADNALAQGKEHMLTVARTEQQLLKQVSDHKSDIQNLIDVAISEVNQYACLAIDRIDAQLSQYDAQLFSRIANESCEQVEKSAQGVIAKSRQLLHLFHWRSAALAFLTTLLTAFAVGLYISDEYPWEIHQHAMYERGAGKMLMSAWPNLSFQERAKILGDQGKLKG